MEEDVITLRVERYRPDDAGPFYQEYRVPYRSDTVVLDALNYVKDHVDGTLTYRWSCRMGICGSCGATVNGVPRLTCETFLKDFKGVVTVGPLEHFPVVKDLVVDISDFLGKLRSVQPWIVRGDINDTSKGEYPQAPWELELYRQQSLCINCMICYSACPVYGHDPRFLGPAAAALAYRYIMDSRDHGRGERLRATMAHDGIYECTFVGECSHVCPKDVDPAAAIQRLKAQGALSLLMPKGGR